MTLSHLKQSMGPAITALIIPGFVSLSLLFTLAKLAEWTLFWAELAILLIMAGTMLYLAHLNYVRTSQNIPGDEEIAKYRQPALTAIAVLYLTHSFAIHSLLTQLQFARK